MAALLCPKPGSERSFWNWAPYQLSDARACAATCNYAAVYYSCMASQAAAVSSDRVLLKGKTSLSVAKPIVTHMSERSKYLEQSSLREGKGFQPCGFCM